MSKRKRVVTRTLEEIESDIEQYGQTPALKAELRRYKNVESARRSRARKDNKVQRLQKMVEQLKLELAEKELEIVGLKEQLEDREMQSFYKIKYKF